MVELYDQWELERTHRYQKYYYLIRSNPPHLNLPIPDFTSLAMSDEHLNAARFIRCGKHLGCDRS